MTRAPSNGKKNGRRKPVAAVISYQRRMDEYPAIYDYALRTVKRWAAIGRECGDPCPLDDPAEMPAWWTRRMKHRVPDAILRAASGSADPQPAEFHLESPSADPNPGGAVDDLPTGRGVEAELERLESLSARLSIKADQPGLTKAYLDSIQRMTSLQKQVREESERARRLLPRDEVEQALHDLHGPIEREMRMMLRTMAEALGLPVTPAMEQRWNKELDAVFARMQEEVFR